MLVTPREPLETKTTCPYCGVGCGLVVRPSGTGGVTVSGDESHPANLGRLCSKGSALSETIGLEGRLLYPMVGGRRTGWTEALDLVAGKLADTIKRHGPDSVGFYVSGQFLTEDYYVAHKLMKGFIGSANIDTNSRLCMASAVAGHKRAFGADTVPGTYADLELADLVVLVGSNLAWCHPVLFQRLAAAKAAQPHMRLVVIDPRRTMTAEAADLHLPLAPGSDVALFNGLLAHLEAGGHVDRAFVDGHTSGAPPALATARKQDLTAVAAATGLEIDNLKIFYDLFTRTERVVTAFSQGVNQSSSGTDKTNAIINCHLFTGRIGKPGMGPFSITGQPNAMGGREVGGLANQLAAHMDIEDPEHRRIVGGFWHAPRMADRPGLKAVDLFRAAHEGKVKAIWIAGTNPVDSMPNADFVRAALHACPFVVVSDVVRDTDTTRTADVLLPAAAWGEKDGTVTNSERRVSRQRAFLPLPGEAKPDWWIFAEVGKRLGWTNAFAYQNAAEVFAEHAELSGVENSGRRDFDISPLAGISRDEYEVMQPFQWPLHAKPVAGAPDVRLFSNGSFYTRDKRARLVPTPFKAPASATSPEFPLVLNTGRVRDQWHTMTRTARSPRLMGHIAEPFAELHPDDAAARGISPASLVEIVSAQGRVIVRAQISPGQRRGSVFAPLHWTDRQASNARVDALTGSHVDPISGQPELKFTPVEVRLFTAAWYGFAVLDREPRQIDAGYWVVAKAEDGCRVELADRRAVVDWHAFARDLFGINTELLAYHDTAGKRHRLAAFDGDRLAGALFVAPEPVALSRTWLAAQLGLPAITAKDRLRLLAGRTGNAADDPGPILCACLGVGLNQINRAITDDGCTTVEAVGEKTRAGTNCGSCRSEIRKMIDAKALQNAV